MYNSLEELLERSGKSVEEAKTLVAKLEEKYGTASKVEQSTLNLMRKSDKQQSKKEKLSMQAANSIAISCDRVFMADLKENHGYDFNTKRRYDKTIGKSVLLLEFGKKKQHNDSRLLVPISRILTLSDYNHYEELAKSYDNHIWGKDGFVKVQSSKGLIPMGEYVSAEDLHCLFGACKYNKYNGKAIPLGRLRRIQNIINNFAKASTEGRKSK